MATDNHPPLTRRSRWFLAALLVPLLAGPLVGLVVLWPDRGSVRQEAVGPSFRATVASLRERPCQDTAPEAGIRCVRAQVRLAIGPLVPLEEQPGDGSTALTIGQRVLVVRRGGAYALVSQERGGALAVLAIVAAVLLVVVARQKGARLLAGLVIAAAVVIVFTLPALLDGSSAVAVAVVSAAVVATTLVVVMHGVNGRSAVGLSGALLAIGLAGGAGWLIGDAAHLAGLPGASPTYLQLGSGTVPMAGLILAGVVLGTVGALLDLTRRQVDATWQRRDAGPPVGWLGLAAAGVRRGGADLADVSATVLLAYTGAVLPVLVLLTAGGPRIFDAVQGETVAVEVARALVGLIALAAAVPLTAAVAATVAVLETRGREGSDPRRFRTRHERQIWDDDDTP